MQPTKKWLEFYAEKQTSLACPVDLNAYFTAGEIAGKKLDRLAIGAVSLPTGKIIVRDPFFLRAYDKPYFQSVPPGEYEVTLAVVAPDETNENGDCARYAAARVRFSEAEAVRYTQALVGNENLLNLSDGEYFGFNVDTGLACICDNETRDAFLAFEKGWEEKNGEDATLYDDYFAALFAESRRAFPRYQRDCGDWINWRIPNTAYRVPIFASGFGDGSYPVYFRVARTAAFAPS
jgi:hypothetical protein